MSSIIFVNDYYLVKSYLYKGIASLVPGKLLEWHGSCRGDLETDWTFVQGVRVGDTIILH